MDKEELERWSNELWEKSVKESLTAEGQRKILYDKAWTKEEEESVEKFLDELKLLGKVSGQSEKVWEMLKTLPLGGSAHGMILICHQFIWLVENEWSNLSKDKDEFLALGDMINTILRYRLPEKYKELKEKWDCFKLKYKM